MSNDVNMSRFSYAPWAKNLDSNLSVNSKYLC
eukprot:CAMPEP_0172858422 /NCGR_PEP_ID=MMETSP1075-20121228/66754_1 /TAXON_ID=2916 /ORGANISM="Ceratium fusus, Strain PA161109" /LENGTH=31 /DNA_ID= /DNA_START= /DNA_END= /DNA_ORIENTATION=